MWKYIKPVFFLMTSISICKNDIQLYTQNKIKKIPQRNQLHYSTYQKLYSYFIVSMTIFKSDWLAQLMLNLNVQFHLN